MLSFIEFQALDRAFAEAKKITPQQAIMLDNIRDKIKNDFVEESKESPMGKIICTITKDQFEGYKTASRNGNLTTWKLAIAEIYNLSKTDFSVDEKGNIRY